MSWEGWGQCLCKNGHEYSIGQYDEGDSLICPYCKSAQAWVHWVDETNGCMCEDRSCPAHKLPLKVKTEAVFSDCECCGHRRLVGYPTYEIPI